MFKALVILVLIAVIAGGATYFSYEMFVRPKEAMKEEIAFGTPTPPPDPTIPEFEKCVAIKNAHKLVEARTAFQAFIENYPGSTKLEDAKDAIGELNVDIFFSATASPEKQEYTIQRGDALAKLEKRFKVPGELIMRSNNLEDPRRLSIGQVLYISHPQFAVVISRKEKKITLYNQGRFFKQYRAKQWLVPPGKNNAAVTAKVTEMPAWVNGARVAFGTKEYATASHWVQLSASSYTLFTDPAEGGEKAPAGITLSAADMQELSALLSRGVPVTIQ
ncbi:MAG: hypothetical protein QOD99_1743 [Chthoniobacter sp.]|jgi:LysM repeat protein|nr:hypothetical protein [Chthoniobacter sp.]